MDGLEITEIRVALATRAERGRLLGFVTLVLNGVLLIRNLRLIAGDAGPFLAMPDRWAENKGRYVDCVQPLRQEVRDWLTAAAVKELAAEQARIGTEVAR